MTKSHKTVIILIFSNNRILPEQILRLLNFMHIGKNAGNQIRHICNQVAPNLDGIEFIFHGHRANLSSIDGADEYFFSIRNPVSRFYSGFYSRKRKGRPKNNVEWRENERRAFAVFEHANELAENLFTESKTGLAAFNAIKSISHTSANQVDRFEGFGFFLETRPPLAIIRQEYLQKDMTDFVGKLGFTGNLPVTSDFIESHKSDYSNIPPLSEKAIANLAQWYSQDMEFYKVCENWINKRNTHAPLTPSDLIWFEAR